VIDQMGTWTWWRKASCSSKTTWMQLIKAGLGVNQVAAKTGTTANHVWAIRVNSGLRPVTPAHVMMRKELSARGPIERVWVPTRDLCNIQSGLCGGRAELRRILRHRIDVVPAVADPRILAHKETHIGKSTLLLQLVANLSAAGLPCLLASSEESRDQVALRAHRLEIPGDRIAFVSGRELGPLVDAARAERPFLLAVDSIQSLRDSAGGQVAGGPAQVRGCTDALVGRAKTEGIAVLLAGHVTKDGDVAGPRTLEHAVDVVLTFDGEPRSGLRMLSGGKNRFGAEGEVAWFEMAHDGLHEIDPGALLRAGEGESGSATALPRLGRRALAVEVQALVVPTDGPARRQATGLNRADSSWSRRCWIVWSVPRWPGPNCSGRRQEGWESTIRHATSPSQLRWPLPRRGCRPLPGAPSSERSASPAGSTRARGWAADWPRPGRPG